MTTLVNATALAISQVAYVFVNRLLEFTNKLEEKGGSSVRHEFQSSSHPLIQTFRNKDFPLFLRVLTQVSGTELSSKKLERIQGALDSFGARLDCLESDADDMRWNFFDGAFSILMSDLKGVLDKPLVQADAFRTTFDYWCYTSRLSQGESPRVFKKKSTLPTVFRAA